MSISVFYAVKGIPAFDTTIEGDESHIKDKILVVGGKKIKNNAVDTDLLGFIDKVDTSGTVHDPNIIVIHGRKPSKGSSPSCVAIGGCGMY